MRKDVHKILNSIKHTSEGKYLKDCLSELSEEGKEYAVDHIVFFWNAGVAIPWGMIKREAMKITNKKTI